MGCLFETYSYDIFSRKDHLHTQKGAHWQAQLH